MHILVDGYNLIGSNRGLTGKLEESRRRLIEQLRLYSDRRGYPVTVVFDGWRSGSPFEAEEMHDGVTVVFSRQGETADSVLKRLADEIGSGCVVVTSDRELRRAVEASGAVAIYSGEFSAKLRGSGDGVREEDGGLRVPTEKRGNARRLSKAERKRRVKLGKL
jgi:hypothetical protein